MWKSADFDADSVDFQKKLMFTPLAPDSKLKLNVISDTFKPKSVGFDRNQWFLLKSAVFDGFWNHEV